MESHMTDTICLRSKRRLNNENPRIRIENEKNGLISIFSVSTKVFICYAMYSADDKMFHVYASER